MGRYLTTTVRPGLDIDLALRSLLQSALAGTGVRVDLDFPGTERLPSVSALRSGGLADWPDGQLERPRIDINAWAIKRQDAINLALEVVAYLRSAEGQVVTFGDGARMLLAACDDVGGLLTGQDDTGAFRATTAVTLTLGQLTPTR